MQKRDFIGIILTFLILEATAALWHLLLFRDFYANVTSKIERPFAEYVIPYLIVTNFIRAFTIVLFFKVFRQVHPSANATWFGTLLGAVSGLTAVEYYGVWQISAISWVFMEGSWAILQGLAYGWVLGWTYRKV